MRRVRTALIGAATGLAVLVGTATSAGAAGAADAVAALQNGVGLGVSRGYPGAMGLIRDGQSGTYVKAGSSTAGSTQPIDPTAKFRIGSNTKLFAAVTVLQLEAEGKLSLNDTVAKWLPNAVRANGWDGNQITVRQLLNHTSRLPEYMPAYNLPYYTMQNVNTVYTPQQLVDAALAQAAGPRPANGVAYYSNTNYVLAGMVIQAVTGNTPAAEVTRRIITPLGLANTSFPETDYHIYGNFVRGWKWPELWLGWQPPIVDATNSNVSLFGPAGAMVSTLDEQATFLQAVFSGQLLPAAQMATLRGSVPLDGAGQPGGMGANHWTYDCASGTKTFWSHGGNVIGYASRWFVSEDGGKAVVVMGNEHHGSSDTQGQLALLSGARDALCALL